jgi:hypothetical protein
MYGQTERGKDKNDFSFCLMSTKEFNTFCFILPLLAYKYTTFSHFFFIDQHYIEIYNIVSQ